MMVVVPVVPVVSCSAFSSDAGKKIRTPVLSSLLIGNLKFDCYYFLILSLRLIILMAPQTLQNLPSFVKETMPADPREPGERASEAMTESFSEVRGQR